MEKPIFRPTLRQLLLLAAFAGALLWGNWNLVRPISIIDRESSPLFHWLMALLPPRVLPALAAAGTLLLCGWIGNMLGGRRTGWSAAGILLSSLGFFSYAHAETPDMLATFWITASIACLIRRSQGGSFWLEFGFLAATALGILSDGDRVALIPLFAGFAWNYGRLRADESTSAQSWWLLLLLLGWIIMADLRHGIFADDLHPSPINILLDQQFTARTPTPIAGPIILTIALLPWLPVGLGALLHAWARRSANSSASPAGWLIIGWVIPAILVMLLVPPRSLGDSLPILPGIALWLAGEGRWIDSELSTQPAGFVEFWCTWWRRVSLLLALMMLVSPALAVAAASLTLPDFRRFGFSPWFGPLIGLLALVCSVGIYLWTRRRSVTEANRWSAFDDAAGAALATLAIGIWMLLGWQSNALRHLLNSI